MAKTLNPRKLLHSKWTAVSPRNREKHFLVVDLVVDDNDTVQECVIEAVINHRQQMIDWQLLLLEENWLQGWR